MDNVDNDVSGDSSNEPDINSINEDSMQAVPVTRADMQTFAAKWILKTGETRSLTRAATQGIIEDVEYLVNFVTQTIESQAKSILHSNGIDPDGIPGLAEVFCGPVTKPFDGLTSFHQELMYCREHFNFIVTNY